MTIIIPMAGLSSRFTKAGYTLPKYMLYIKDKSLFNIAVSSFEKYFDSCSFLFVARDVYDTPRFIEEECKLMGVRNYKIVSLDHPTQGQAETVLLGIRKANIPHDEPILVFNIDTFRPNFEFPKQINKWDGFLEVFEGSGKNWSYAKTETPTSTKVIQTAEKKEISNYCSTGLYYFNAAKKFIDAYNISLEVPNEISERYVAPLYNHLIKQGSNIHISLIKKDQVIFCGVPSEYEECVKKFFLLDCICR